MPELPEVETMVRDLRARLPGRSIVETNVHWDRMVGHPSPEGFKAGLHGRRLEAIERRGKFALLALDGGGVLGVHRGMTGSLFLRPAGFEADRFVRAWFRLDDGDELRFDDSRKFGRLYLYESVRNGSQPPWERLGVEPLSEEFTALALFELLAGRRAAIKTVLLNQLVVAGIGNIYADEALFAAGIRPTRPAGSLRKREVGRLRDAVSSVLAGAIARRGTTFSTYRDVDGEAGGNQSRLMVFHRHG
ncbi:MAG TPA: DNA-formamidopyrimidine glycosylase, partial [Chloroflexota bacterium]|nr:DNA-formamidopyrimidine glycosylase [Chloroflexota bacterium]